LSEQENRNAALDGTERDLPEHFQTLFERSVADLPDAGDRIAIRGLLANFANVFIGPDGQMGPTDRAP
jgi:hypothetical protein